MSPDRVHAVGRLVSFVVLSALLTATAFAWQQQVPNIPAPADQSGTGPDPAAQAPASPPQASPVPSPGSALRKMHCPHPANPRRRHTSCNNEKFDWDETFSRDYYGLREKLRQLGITPTLSYTGALQTNVTGQTHQIWGYAGQLVGGLNVDFNKLLKIRGMSVYVGGS